jgi:hypothetical protein
MKSSELPLNLSEQQIKSLVLIDPFVLRSGRLTNEAPWKRWRTEVDRLGGVVAGLAVEYGTELIPYPKAMNSLHATG